MKLLYKDLALAVHPTFYIFTQLGCLVLAPAYPYTVVFLLGCLAPYISFMYARETNDAWFTALLPVKKKRNCRIQISSGLLRAAYPTLYRARVCSAAVFASYSQQPRWPGSHRCLVWNRVYPLWRLQSCLFPRLL